MNLSLYTQNIVASYFTGVDFPSAPSSLSLGLSTTTPAVDGTNITEPAGADGYSRQVVTFSSVVSVVGNGSSMTLDAPASFGPVINTQWNTVTHAVLYDDSGNVLMFSPLAVAKTGVIGDSISFNIGAVLLQTDTMFGHYLSELLLNWMKGSTPPTSPAALNLNLSYTDPTEDGAGLIEPIGGYTKQTVAFNSPITVSETTHLISQGPYVFGPSTAVWGNITHAAITIPTGDMLIYGPVALVKSVDSGDSYAIPIGAFNVVIQ